MTADQFITDLAAAGYGEIVTVEREAGGRMALHAHPFEARALILAGEITLRIDGQQTVYSAGQTFHLTANLPHEESYGPSGVRYLVGRK